MELTKEYFDQTLKDGLAQQTKEIKAYTDEKIEELAILINETVAKKEDITRLEGNIANLASKEELQATEQRLKQDLQVVEVRLKKEIVRTQEHVTDLKGIVTTKNEKDEGRLEKIDVRLGKLELAKI